jgi:hypothetical protein
MSDQIAVSRSMTRTTLLLPSVAILLAAMIIGLTVSAGIKRGMDHSVTIGPGEQTAIAIALSDSIYHVNLGYVGLAKVFATIQEYWNRSADNWSKLDVLKDNFHNADLLNGGIRAAASLGPQEIGYVSNGTLITTIYDDMGEVDFVSLAFRLFGLKIQSLFYFYFTLVSLSAIVFILTFRSNVYALGVVLCVLFAYYIEIYLAAFDPIAVPTFFGMRHSSTLGLIPMWHFIFLLLLRKKPAPATLAGGLIQLAILVLALRIRGSVAWMFMFVFVLAFVLALRHVWSHPRRKGWLGINSRPAFGQPSLSTKADGTFVNPWSMLLSLTLRWPILLLLSGMLANGAYNRVALHPVYFTDDVMAYHSIWYVAYLGLAKYDPEILSPRIALLVKEHGVGGAFTSPAEGWWATRDYMDRIHLVPWSGSLDLLEPAPGLLSDWGIGMKNRLHDQLMQRAFFEIIRHHPFKALKIYAFIKPKEIVRAAISPFIRAATLKWLWLIGLAGAGLCAILMAFVENGDVQPLRSVLVTTAAVTLAAVLPNLWGYPVFAAMADGILSIVTLLSVALGLAFFMLWRKTYYAQGRVR